MLIPPQLSKNLLLIGVLKECTDLLSRAHSQLHDPEYQEVAAFADSAHSLLLQEVFEEEINHDKKN